MKQTIEVFFHLLFTKGVPMKMRSIRTVQLCLEQLESRLTPTVTVANAANGAVMITGDNANNSIQVQAGPGFVNVVGVNGTQVNFAQGFNPGAFNGDIDINLGGGNDQVEIANSFLPGQVQIDEGDGNNTVLIQDVFTPNQITVNNGAGSDAVQIFNAGFGNATINGGAGTDNVNISQVWGNGLNMNGGAGTDNVILRNASFGAANLVGGTGGTDTLDVDSSVSFGSLTETGFQNQNGG